MSIEICPHCKNKVLFTTDICPACNLSKIEKDVEYINPSKISEENIKKNESIRKYALTTIMSIIFLLIFSFLGFYKIKDYLEYGDIINVLAGISFINLIFEIVVFLIAKLSKIISMILSVAGFSFLIIFLYWLFKNEIKGNEHLYFSYFFGAGINILLFLAGFILILFRDKIKIY